MKACNCEDYKQNIPKIDAAFTLMAVRGNTRGYDGKFIEFCPWCGKKLVEEIDNGNI